MGRKAAELGALQVGRLKEPGLHFVGGVDGLALQVTGTGARSWVLRVRVAGRRREMGLGGFPDVTLAAARDAAREARIKIKQGVDPIEHARVARSALAAKRATDVSFKHCAEKYIASHEARWSAKSLHQWNSSLEKHAYPKIGNLLVRDVGLPQVLDVLTPIWNTKTETATRIRGRIEKILDWATVARLRSGDNPARWRSHLEVMLPAPTDIAEPEHFKAVPYTKVGAFVRLLREEAGQGARCLEFAILTAARSAQARGATWGEISLRDAMWTIPKERMKANRDHRVPLSKPAVALLKAQSREDGVDLVFPSPTGKVLSDATLGAVLKRMGVDAVPHGFRSTFKDWCAELTDYPNEVSEMALAHAVADKVEAAYRRGDMFRKRKGVLEDWATFCSSVYEEPASADVLEMPARVA
jgi:integrase